MKDISYFSQFSDVVDEEFNKQVEEAENQNGDKKYEKVPDGKYEVRVIGLEICRSKKSNKWQVMATLPIINNKEYEGRYIWAYFSLNPKVLHKANTFLRSLNSGLEVKYKSERQYAELIDNILDLVKDSKEFALDMTTNKDGYRDYKIYKVFESSGAVTTTGATTTDDDELPFS